MLTGKDKVVEFLKFNDCKFWRLRRTEAGPFLFQSLNKDFTIDDSMRRLNDALNNLDAGNYFFECGDSADDKRGWYKSPFRLTEGNPFAFQQSMAGIGSISPEIIEQKIEEALVKERNARKIEELEKELKLAREEKRELEQERDGLMLRLGKRIEPYIGTIIEALGLKPQVLQPSTAIAGIDETIVIRNKTKQDMPEEKIQNVQERLEKAFETWAQYEDDSITIIEKIVELASTKPEVYKKAKALLMNPTMLNLLS